ncbi:Rho GTPase activation protein [Gongronella butleri]|nr:Rho GTPase activation protein [Gongronella butleri]
MVLLIARSLRLSLQLSSSGTVHDNKAKNIAVHDHYAFPDLNHDGGVPQPVQLCFNEITRRGLDTVGLFRLSGATAEVKQLQQAFESQDHRRARAQHQQQLQQQQRARMAQSTLVYMEEDAGGMCDGLPDLARYDIHSIASYVKKYLFHMPVAVIPPEHHAEFLQTAYLPKEEAIGQLSHLVTRLPLRHRRVLHAILELSAQIQQHADVNKMTAEALAVVLVPVCTGLENTLQILPKKQQKKRKGAHPLNPVDLQRLVRTNAQWTLLWKWMIEEHAQLVHVLATSIATQTHAPKIASDNVCALYHAKSLPMLRGSPPLSRFAPPPTTTMSPSSPSACSFLPMDPYAPSMHHAVPKKSVYLDASLPKPTAADKQPKLRPKSSCQSILMSTASLVPKPAGTGHGLLRRLASVSSFR